MTPKLRLLLVDDEPLAIRRLLQALREREDVDVVGEAYDGVTAVEEAMRLRPDVIILDVEMPGLDGLQVAMTVGASLPAEIIVHSAFDRYAARAFEIQALDYLLKPLRSDRLAQALGRAERRRAERSAYRNALREDLPAAASDLFIPDRHGGAAVPISSIIWIEAARDYAIVHAQTQSYILRTTMGDLAETIPEPMFRVHRSAFVNASEVRRWTGPSRGVYRLMLSDGSSIPVGPSYLVEVRQRLRSVSTASVVSTAFAAASYSSKVDEGRDNPSIGFRSP